MKMKKTIKLLALLLACAMVMVSLAACGDSGTPGSGTASDSSPETSQGGGSDGGGGTSDPDRPLNIAVSLDSGTLNPLAVSGSGGYMNIMWAFYEPLIDFTDEGEIIWILATSIDRISDINCTLNIREGVTFSNGNPLTAEDVMFTMELCRDDPQFFLNVKVVDFEKTKVTGDYTIDLWYTEFNASQEPGFSQMLIHDKESYDAQHVAMNPIGTGPYVLSPGGYVVNSHVYIEARDDYWGGPPPIKNINFKCYNEEAQRVNALEKGDVDMAIIPLKDVGFVESLGYDARILYGAYTDVIYFNMTPDASNPVGTKEARWAVCHAIDREAISDIVYSGRSMPASWPSSERMLDYEPRFSMGHDTYSVGYNLDRAKQLAEQSGLVGQTVRIITNGAEAMITTAEIIQNGLSEIGVNSQIVNHDQATYFGLLMNEENYEIAIHYMAAPSALASDVLAMYPTFIPLGWVGPDRDLYGQYSMGALTTADPVAAGDLLYQALPILYDSTPWYSLCEMVSARAQAKDLAGVAYTMSGIVYYQHVSWR